MRIYDQRLHPDALATQRGTHRRRLRRGHNDILYKWEQRYVCHNRRAPSRARTSENRIERRTIRHYLRSLP